MTHPHYLTRYPTVAGGFPAELEMMEAEQAGEAWIVVPVTADLRRREIAAGLAHIDRLSVDGGPMRQPRPIRRRYTREAMGLIGMLVCALAAVVIVYGVGR